MSKPWKIKSVAEPTVQQLGAALSISPLLARLLVLRGLDQSESAHKFLHPASQAFEDPFQFSEMPIALDRLIRARERRERVIIHGDYDVDGITGACILLETFREFGIPTDYFLPHRFTDGYGLREETVRRLASEYSLLVTVDCGATAVRAVEIANELGLDVIITDHHDPGPQRPPALAILNPMNSTERYPFKSLSGAGVAWKLATALRIAFSKTIPDPDHLELTALGMIADVMPVLGENRILLHHGLTKFSQSQRPGLLALMELSKVVPAQITSQILGHRIAPRLNAAGRMDHPRFALELLLTRDETQAWELAHYLHQLNSSRQSIEKTIYDAAISQIADHGLNTRSDRFLLVSGKEWHRGVLGIVAQRLVQRFGKPAFLFSIENGVAYGSVRSVENLNLIPVLEQTSSLTLSCGGHASAAGVKVASDRLETYSQALQTATQQAWSALPTPWFWLDASIPLEQIDHAFMADLKTLEPYGPGNEEPLFCTQAVVDASHTRIVGNDHLRFTLRHRRGYISAIGFGLGNRLEQLTSPEIAVAFHCRYNEYQGRQDIQLNVIDFHPISTPAIELRSSPKPPLDRNRLGMVYRLLRDSGGEEGRINRQNSRMLAQLAKISDGEWETALKIFTEIDLILLNPNEIVIKKVETKRELSDSPTFRSQQS